MISLETAKKLKEAGLQWEPQEGDAYITEDTIFGYEIYKGEAIDKDKCAQRPRLDQMLAEIEKLGYAWELSVDEADKPPYAICIFSTPREIGQKWFTADSPEEATALALLWILEQEAV